MTPEGRYAHLNPKLAVDRPFEGDKMNGNNKAPSWIGPVIAAVVALGTVAVSYGALSTKATEHERRLTLVEEAYLKTTTTLAAMQKDLEYLRRDVDARRGTK